MFSWYTHMLTTCCLWYIPYKVWNKVIWSWYLAIDVGVSSFSLPFSLICLKSSFWSLSCSWSVSSVMLYVTSSYADLWVMGSFPFLVMVHSHSWWWVHSHSWWWVHSHSQWWIHSHSQWWVHSHSWWWVHSHSQTRKSCRFTGKLKSAHYWHDVKTGELIWYNFVSRKHIFAADKMVAVKMVKDVLMHSNNLLPTKVGVANCM